MTRGPLGTSQSHRHRTDGGNMRTPRFPGTRLAVLMISSLLAVLVMPAPVAQAADPPVTAQAYYFWITSTRSGDCLSVAGASTDDGATVLQQPCIETAYEQHWSFYLIDDRF